MRSGVANCASDLTPNPFPSGKGNRSGKCGKRDRTCELDFGADVLLIGEDADVYVVFVGVA